MKKLFGSLFVLSAVAALVASPVMAHEKHPRHAVKKACHKKFKKNKEKAEECEKAFEHHGAFEGVEVEPADAQKCQAHAKGEEHTDNSPEQPSKTTD